MDLHAIFRLETLKFSGVSMDAYPPLPGPGVWLESLAGLWISESTVKTVHVEFPPIDPQPPLVNLILIANPDLNEVRISADSPGQEALIQIDQNGNNLSVDVNTVKSVYGTVSGCQSFTANDATDSEGLIFRNN